MKQICFVLALMFFSTFAHAREDALANLAGELSTELGRKGPVTVAVLALPHHDNRLSDGPLLVCERLTTLLAQQKNIVVVERNHLTQVLGENHLAETGALDPETTRLMGKVLGADVLILGSLINLIDNKTEVNVRGVRADTGRVLAAARTTIDRTWESKQVLAW